MSLESCTPKEQMASIVDEKQMLFEGPNQGDHQRKLYKRRRAKVRRSKSQGYKHDSDEFTDALKGKLGCDDGSSDEDIVKLKEKVKLKGRSNRKVVMFDWDKSPFVFSVEGKGRDSEYSGQDEFKAPKLVKCKNIATIDEEDESDTMQADARTGRCCSYNQAPRL